VICAERREIRRCALRHVRTRTPDALRQRFNHPRLPHDAIRSPSAPRTSPDREATYSVFLEGTHPQITAAPARDRPEVWMFGSSDFGAQIAGAPGSHCRWPSTFASHHHDRRARRLRRRVLSPAGAQGPARREKYPGRLCPNGRAGSVACRTEHACVRSLRQVVRTPPKPPKRPPSTSHAVGARDRCGGGPPAHMK